MLIYVQNVVISVALVVELSQHVGVVQILLVILVLVEVDHQVVIAQLLFIMMMVLHSVNHATTLVILVVVVVHALPVNLLKIEFTAVPLAYVRVSLVIMKLGLEL